MRRIRPRGDFGGVANTTAALQNVVRRSSAALRRGKSELPTMAPDGFGLARRICRAAPFTGAPIRTAQVGNREGMRRSPHRAPDPTSPLPVHQTPTAKTPRNREIFSDHRQLLGRSLCTHRLNGGGGSPGRTRLCGLIPVKQGKYREFLRYQAPMNESGPRFPSVSADVTSNSL